MMDVAVWVLIAISILFGFVVFFGSPYVPSKRRDLAYALDNLYALTAADFLVDLGSGDGVVLREASKRGARAKGIELNPILVLVSRLFAAGDSNITTTLGNLRTTSFPKETTVVYTFPNSRDISALTRKIRSEATKIGHPIAVISYGSTFPDLEHTKSEQSHHLYLAHPLQDKKPQV